MFITLQVIKWQENHPMIWIKEPETSSVTVKNGRSKVGGYECDFVESPADDMLCKICHYPAHNPVLTVCCGHSFCNYCMEHYKQSRVNDHDKCPYCCEEKFNIVPDNRTEHYVLILKVFCPHKCEGCNWTGELQSMEDHVNKNSKSTNNNIGFPFTRRITAILSDDSLVDLYLCRQQVFYVILNLRPLGSVNQIVQ